MLKRFYLEITNSCNLDCPFCTNEKGHDYLSLTEIDDYTSQIKEYCDYIYLHILGEPLLHPDFTEILDILDKKELKLQLVTNGVLLDEHLDIFQHECLRKLSISLHSVNNLHIDDSYFRTIDKIIEMNHDCHIELRFYDQDSLDDELSAYLSSLKQRYGFLITPKTNSYRLKDKVYLYFADLFKWPDINDPYISCTGSCHGGIDMLAINSRSDITLCCLDPKAYNRLGNLKSTSLKKIIESAEYQQIINDLKHHKLDNELCQKCSYRLRFKS